MAYHESTLLRWVEQGALSPEHLERARALAGVSPDAKAWRRFLEQLFLWFGTASLATAFIFFIAYNWFSIGHYPKFAMAEALIVLAVAAYWKLDPDRASGKSALLFASLAMGALLALYGQTYQTGADPWQLLAVWALLILPWVLVAQFPALWIFWLTLLNGALNLTFWAFPDWLDDLFFREGDQMVAHFLLNTLALVVWEMAAPRFHWLRERWAPRLLAFAGGGIVTTRCLWDILELYGQSAWGTPAWLAWMGGIYLAYRKRNYDLFMLALGGLSFTVIATTWVGQKIFANDHDIFAFLFLGLFIIGLTTVVSRWLRGVAKEVRA